MIIEMTLWPRTGIELRGHRGAAFTELNGL